MPRSKAMILNAYAVLDAFLSLLRLGLGLLVIALGMTAWRAYGRSFASADEQKAREDRWYLLFLLGGLLLVLNILSWPLFYLLLQSYVAEWPGVMCIYGVTQIGVGSLGPSRFLPPLLTALQIAKPALVFMSGAWFVLYWVNHGARTAPLTRRVLVVMLAAGFLGFGDAAAEIAYLLIPKKEVFASAGCCTPTLAEQDPAARFIPRSLMSEDKIPSLYWAYYGVNGVQLLALAFSRRLFSRGYPTGLLTALVLGAALCLAVSSVFLVDVAAPRLLHLPYHHCPYDLIPKVPETVVAVALYLGGTFAVGWAGVLGFLGRVPESEPLLPGMIGRLLSLASLGYLLAITMLSLELVLA
jgi:hypothetical protein